MDCELLLSTDIARIRKNQLKEILFKHNILTTNEKTESIRKKASILKQSILLARSEPSLRDFIKGVINQTHVIDATQKLQFPILAELEKIVLYGETSSNTDEHAYEHLSSSDSEPDNPPLSNKSKIQTPPSTATPNDHISLEHKPHINVSQTVPAMAENLPLISAGSFNGLNSENATDFIEKYLLAADSNNWSDNSKLKLFPSHLGGIAINWFKNYKAKAPIPDWATLKNDFLQAFTPLAQCSSLSAILENKLQGPNETTLSYLLDIVTTCRRYDPEITEAQIIQYILRGLRPEIFQKVLTKQNDTLDRLEKNLKDAELLEIKLKQNLALYSKQSSTPNTLMNSSNHPELSKLQQQVQVLTDLVATMLPNKSHNKNRYPRGNVRDQYKTYQHNLRPNQTQPQNTQQQNSFKTPHAAAQSQPRDTQVRYAQSPRFCDYCKTNTHSTEFCWFRMNRSDRPPQEQSIICRYCKQQGHVIQQCIKSRFYNPHYNVGPHQHTPSPASTSSNPGNGPAGGSRNQETPRS